MNLLDCFRAMCKREQLDQQNQWYCNQCKEHVCAFKSLKLWKLPNILVVQVAVTCLRSETPDAPLVRPRLTRRRWGRDGALCS